MYKHVLNFAKKIWDATNMNATYINFEGIHKDGTYFFMNAF
jgi:hypothetical protein